MTLLSMSACGGGIVMVSLHTEERINGAVVCYTEYYNVPKKVSDEGDQAIRAHIEKRNLRPVGKEIKSC